jgi:hypothetical protein
MSAACLFLVPHQSEGGKKGGKASGSTGSNDGANDDDKSAKQKQVHQLNHCFLCSKVSVGYSCVRYIFFEHLPGLCFLSALEHCQQQLCVAPTL